jgi:hypothetical protein
MYPETRPMNPVLLWVTTVVLGLAASLLVGVGGVLGFVFVVLAGALVLRGARLVALSGLLTGFGGSWLFMMERQFASGGRLDNADFWLAIGTVPLVIGVALAVGVVVIRARGVLATRS